MRRFISGILSFLGQLFTIEEKNVDDERDDEWSRSWLSVNEREEHAASVD